MIFRYPGGKTKLASLLIEFFPKSGDFTFIEPFVGGGAVSILMAAKNKECRFWLNDKDDWMYSFWKVIAEGSESEFSELLAHAEVKPDLILFKFLREQGAVTLVDKAYRALFFNRTTFSGMLNGNPIGGWSQNSKWTVDCRYTPKNVVKRLQCVRELFFGRTTVTCLDIQDVLCQVGDFNTYMYLDPPYVVKGDSLYRESMTLKDHESMASNLRDKSDWLLSYDKCDIIQALYGSWADLVDLEVPYSINGKKKSWIKKKEFLITPIKT